jgi:hypothetical protein
VIDSDGEWREAAGGKARELISPSEEWLERASDDPDSERLYAEAQARNETQTQGE